MKWGFDLVTMTLAEITKAAGGISNMETGLTFSEICTDTRKITNGCLYIALQGERFDGHDFIEDAFEKGAAAAVSSRQLHLDKPLVLVRDTRIALGKIASYYRAKFDLRLVGVTGSVGKTSTKEMIAAVLSAKYNVHKTKGNFNNDIGLPMTLFQMEQEHTASVIEMGMSDLGEISYLSKLAKPDLGVITNIGVSHMENLGSQENILKAKLEILDGMKSGGKLILNGDDDLLHGAADSLKVPVLQYGIERRNLFVTADNIRQERDSTLFDFIYQGKRYPARLPVLGIHNVKNALAAFCVGIETGITPEEIADAVGYYQNSGMRQRIREYNGIKVIADCYNASPDSMKAAMDVLGRVACSGKRVAVLGDMLDLGSRSDELHFDVGRLVADSDVDLLVCYGPQAEQIAEGAKENGLSEVVCFHNKKETADYISGNLQSGDAAIFKASRAMRLEEIMEQVFHALKNT